MPDTITVPLSALQADESESITVPLGELTVPLDALSSAPPREVTPLPPRLPIVPIVPTLKGPIPPAPPPEVVSPAAAAWKRATPGVDQPAPTLEEFAKVPIISAPAVGVAQAARGVAGLARAAASTTLPPAQPPPQTGAEAYARSTPAVTQTQPTEPLSAETMAAGSDVLEGAFKILEPVLVVAGIAAPFATLTSLVAAYGASKATEFLSRKAGLNEEQTRLLSNVAGAVAASVAPGSVRTGIEDAAAWGRERTAARETRRSWPIDVKTGKRVDPGTGAVVDTAAVRQPIADLPPVPDAPPIEVAIEKVLDPTVTIEQIADEMLAPPAPLTEPPVESVQKHPEIGANITPISTPITAPIAAPPEPDITVPVEALAPTHVDEPLTPDEQAQIAEPLAPAVDLVSGAATAGERAVSGAENKGSSGNNVKPWMRTRSLDRKVVIPIVRSIPVSVMDVLGGEERATDLLLHNQAVFADALAASGSADVASLISSTREVVAASRTKLRGARPGTPNAEYDAALEAFDRELGKRATTLAARENLPTISSDLSSTGATPRTEAPATQSDLTRRQVLPEEAAALDINTLDEHGEILPPKDGSQVDVMLTGAQKVAAPAPVSTARDLTIHERRELRRILVELQSMPFTKRGFVDAGLRRGGDLEVVPGAAGAPVYDDILQMAPGTSMYSRGSIARMIDRFLQGTGKPTNPVRGAIAVARARMTGTTYDQGHALSKPSLPVDAGDEPGQIYVQRTKDLASEAAVVHEAVAARVEAAPAAMIAAYRAKFPDVIGADEAKELFPEYADSHAAKTANTLAVHAPSQALAQAVYEQAISEPVREGRDPEVVFTAGGMASGKTTGLQAVLPDVKDLADIVYDSTLTDRRFAFRNIDRALDSDRGVTIVFTYRPVDAAFRSALARAKDTGRVVTVANLVRSHTRALDTIQAIQDRYGDRVKLVVVDNSGTPDQVRLSSVQELTKIHYNDADVRQALHDILDAEETAGTLTPALAAATRGQSADAGHDRAQPRDRERSPQARSSVDILDTGEAQPRLPEAGTVRDTENKTPEFDAPFSLTPETHDAGSVQDDLFKGGGGSSSSMQSAVIPGLKEFVEQDLVPGGKEAAETFVAASADIRNLFAPQATSTAARDFAHLTRAHLAVRDQRSERARRVTNAFARHFDRALRGAKTDEQKADVLLRFTDAVEGGKTADLNETEFQAAQLFRDLLDARRDEIQRLGRLQSYIANYFPHEWAEPNEAKNAILRLFGKRPLQGPKSFLKKRTIPTVREGIEKGLVPVSYNPVELVLRKLVEMDKFIAATCILKDGVDQSLAAYVPIGSEPPEGWQRFEGSFGTVYGKPVVEVKEAYDPVVRDGLTNLLKDLRVHHERKVRIGGRRWGYAEGDAHVVTKFAGPEGVLMHELGHILDERYGLRAEMVKDKQFKQELRDLADLRDENEPVSEYRKRYVRKGEEKIANLVHAYLYMPDRAKKVAPNSYWKLQNLIKAHKELRGLKDIQKAKSLKLAVGTTEIPVGGAVIKGYYYGPPEVVRLLHNHLAPGLRSSTAFNLYRRAGNFMNSVQLGLSAFHMTMTGLESVISKQSLALELLARGEVGAALRKQLEVPFSPLIDLRHGHVALKKFYGHDANAATLDTIIDTVVQGGGGFGWSLFEHEGAPAKFMQALRQGNYPGALLRGVPALIELQAKPIMEGWVPRLKMAAFLDLMEMEMRSLGEEPNLQEVRRVAADAWDSIDNRFGQLRYDNLFWHTALKDLGMASVRALGWNVGSVREAFGAPGAQLRQVGLLPGGGYGGQGGGGRRPIRMIDAGLDPDGNPRYEKAKEPWLHRKTSWLIATVFIYGLLGATYEYLHTGTGPKELKDYFFPHDSNGQRISIPGYFKDWYEFFTHPVRTITNKANPLLSLLVQIWNDEDYYGTQIVDWNDDRAQQLKDLFDYLAKDFQPFSLRSFGQRQTEQVGARPSVNAVESVLGINRAPKAVTETDAEAMVRRFHPPEGRTKTQAADAAQSRAIRQGLQAKTPEGRQQAATAIRSGELSVAQIQSAVRGAQRTRLQASVRSLTLDQALRVYEVATPTERSDLRSAVLVKGLSLAKVAPADREALRLRYKAALALPYTKPATMAAAR